MPKMRTVHPPDLRILEGRFKAVRLCAKCTWKRCAQLFGVSWYTWRSYETGARSIPEDILRKLCAWAGTSYPWLLTGQGRAPAKLKGFAHIQADGTLYEPRKKCPKHGNVALS